MRYYIRHIILSFLGRLKKPSKSIHILNGHYINKINTNEDKETFEELLDDLSKNFKLIRFEDACELIKTKQKVTEPMLAFSFDDGFKTCYEQIAPVLEKFKINGAFFINPGAIESDLISKNKFLDNIRGSEYNHELMSWQDIQDLHLRGHIIGNHGMYHNALLGLSSNEASEEILSGKLLLELKLKYCCKYFAFTYGNPSYFDNIGLQETLKHHELVFTSYKYQKYFFESNPRILSRRHFEGGWPLSHVIYFTAKNRVY